ncbi:hypothetical protein SCUCBS95973_009006 [Sporothrix curviconia]|uniref:Uncharacterized protein n=1 Tax=Sporothrix curviconia TaxID=1260050 RepID=A0ABP0CST2_9PEZI
MPYTNYRHHSFSSRASSASLSDHEDDAITPVEEHDVHHQDERRQEAPCQKPVPPSAVDNPFENARLWHRMLALQRRYHCYNSARMSAALEDAQVEAVVPPRACMDLLNDSMATAWLCEEARAEVAALLTLVPDGIRSRTGSYGDIYEGEKPSQIAAPVAAAPVLSMPAIAPAATAATTMSTPNSRQSARQQRMQRRRGIHQGHDE